MRMSVAVRLAVLAAMLCAFGCNSNNKGKIEGTKWSSEATNVKGGTAPAGAIRFEFSTGDRMTYYINDQPHTGT